MPSKFFANLRTPNLSEMGKARADLEKLAKNTNQFISKPPASVEKLCKNIENFDSRKLSGMLEKLDAQLYQGTNHLLSMPSRKPALASFHRGVDSYN